MSTGARGHRLTRILVRLLFAVLAAAILVGAAGTGALMAYQNRYADRIYPGVTVEGIDLAGLDRPGARIALERGLAHYGQGSVAVTADGRTFEVPFAAANRRVDIDALVEQAFTVGRTGDTVSRAAGGVRALFDVTVLQPALLVDEPALAAAVDRLAAGVDAEPIDATAVATATDFATTPATLGKRLDRGTLTAEILGALRDPGAAASIAIPGRVASIPAGIDDADAAAAAAAARAVAQDVVLVVGTDTWTIPAATVHSWISFGQDASGAYAPVIAQDAARQAVEALLKTVNREPVEATFGYSRSTGKVTVTPGRDGRSLDVDATTTSVVGALRARSIAGAPSTPLQVALVATVRQPELTTEAAKKAVKSIRKISTWTTYYQVSSHNGFGNNISIPAREINGTVVAPGATFEWWAALAPVNDASLLARGYRYGGAIINGHSAEGKAIAGGICSSSTTLFNAVARAGYRIDSRYNHYYFIDRYPTGMDATVVYGSKTLRWTNDTKYPVIIRGWGSPGVVTFALYTVPVNTRKAVGGGSLKPGRPSLTYLVANGRKVTFTNSGLSGYTPPGSPITQTTTNPRENGTVIDYPLPGFNVTVWRKVQEGGKVILRDKWFSHYTMMRLLTLVYRKVK